MVRSKEFYILLILVFFGALIYPSIALCQSDGGPLFLDRNLAGGRIGVWTNVGDANVSADSDYSLEFSNSSICADFFYAWRLNRALSLDFQLGLYSRGEVEYKRDSGKYVGTVNIFPFFAAAKFYPLYKIESIPVHLYFQPGFGLVIGSQSVVDYNVYYGNNMVQQETRASITYMLAAGIDWPVADQISLLLNYKYVPVKFGTALAQLKDYSGWSLTFGVGYIFGS